MVCSHKPHLIYACFHIVSICSSAEMVQIKATAAFAFFVFPFHPATLSFFRFLMYFIYQSLFLPWTGKQTADKNRSVGTEGQAPSVASDTGDKSLMCTSLLKKARLIFALAGKP